MSFIQRRVFVSGRVQGVGFRESTVKHSAGYGGIAGFVRNLEDGRVEALIVGEQDQVFAMIDWLKHGPSSARVEGLEVIEEAPTWAEPGFKRA